MLEVPVKLIDRSTPKYPNTFTKVDDADFDWLNQWKWGAERDGNTTYAKRYFKINGKSIRFTMHRFIMRTPKGKVTDHQDHDGLNNQRANLRVCTHSENMMGQKPQSGTTSRFKGVSFSKEKNKFAAQIITGGVKRHLGLFVNEIDAAEAYNSAAIEMHGSFAYLNEINHGNRRPE